NARSPAPAGRSLRAPPQWPCRTVLLSVTATAVKSARSRPAPSRALQRRLSCRAGSASAALQPPHTPKEQHMPHDINQMVFTGETPWHGLGRRLPRNGTWDEIRDAAGFYRAEEVPLFLAGNPSPIPDKKGLVRSDSHQY